MLPAVPQYGGIVLSEASAMGAHGSALVQPSSISDQIEAMPLVDGRGEVVVATGELFLSARLHLGMLGIMVNVTLPMAPVKKLKVEGTVLDEGMLLDGGVVEMARAAEYLLLQWAPSENAVVVSKGELAPADAPGDDQRVLPLAWVPVAEVLEPVAEGNPHVFLRGCEGCRGERDRDRLGD
eukprot:evm.model.scf_1077.1 EVM.evm.TU.scf_1077.1   scf_1077:4756-5298(+)